MAAPTAQVNPFELARKRASQQEGAALQGQKDAIARRSAQLGGGPSGAMIKQEALAADASQKRLGDVNEGINAQEQAEAMRVREIQEGRQFQTSERLGSQEFASGEAGKQRTFTTGERLGGQDFAAGEAGKQRTFATGERIGGQEFVAGQSAIQRAYGTSEREAGQTYGTSEREASQMFSGGQLDKQIAAQNQQTRMQLDTQLEMQKKSIEDAVAARKMSSEQANAALAETKRQYDADLKENIKTNYINSVLSAHNSKMPPEQMRSLLDGLGVVFLPDGNVSISAPATPGVTATPPPPDWKTQLKMGLGG